MGNILKSHRCRTPSVFELTNEPVDAWYLYLYSKTNSYVSPIKGVKPSMISQKRGAGAKLSRDHAAILTDNDLQRDRLLEGFHSGKYYKDLPVFGKLITKTMSVHSPRRALSVIW